MRRRSHKRPYIRVKLITFVRLHVRRSSIKIRQNILTRKQAINNVLGSKYSRLKEILNSYLPAGRQVRGLLVAYSGGVDSSFLLKVAHDVLKNNVLAVIAVSETYTKEEGNDAVKFVKKLGVKYKVIRTEEFKDKKFVSNPKDRCYFCKKELFTKLKDIAKKEEIKYVADGSNISDISDYRPGAKAKDELGVVSPLKEAGFTKEDIRVYSRKLKLNTWNKPALACLASRIPYGTAISKDILAKVEKGERYLRGLGLSQVRVRHHGNLARIEVEKESLPHLIEDGLADKIDKKFRDIGYHYVTIDLKGYRTGSMNEVL